MESYSCCFSTYSHYPWILLGDYNEILSSPEHSRAGDYRTDQVGMRQFQDQLMHCALSDLTYVGLLFTWWNKRDINHIGKKLDRVPINGNWLTSFLHAYATFEAGGVSTTPSA